MFGFRALRIVALGVSVLAACAAAGADDPASTQLPANAPEADAAMPFGPSASACPDGKKTTVRGKVYDPAGKTPLYNVVVAVPSGPVAPLSQGLSCDRCGEKVSGAPYATALSGPDGSFQLDDVPAGDDVPLVVQIGRWRRQTKIPHVEKCQDNVLADKQLTRLPASQAEGDIPKMAIVTGAKDALECTLLRLGIAKSELTLPSGKGRIHVYRSVASTGGARLDGVDAAAMPTGKDLYGTPEGGRPRLSDYDTVLFDCEDGEAPDTKDDVDRQNVVDYANAGGRVFTSHKSGNAWIEHGAKPFPSTASWGIACCGETATVDTSFPKGKAFAEWLFDVHASVKKGEIAIVEPLRSINGVAKGGQAWLSMPDNGNVVEYGFNTPVGKPASEQCGRVVFSNFHVIKSTEDYGAGTAADRAFPSGCNDNDLSGNELALAFLFFDLGSCIQDDAKMPGAPR